MSEGPRRNQLTAQMAILPPITPSNGAQAMNKDQRFLDQNSAGFGGVQPLGVGEDAGLSKRKKAQRYRDLTCPRTRTSTLADGTRIVTVGSHVLVYPANSSEVVVEEGAQKHPKNKSAAAGAVTTFEEHPIWQFPDDSFKHYSLGVGLYFKGVRVLAWIFFICSIITLPSVIISILVNPSDSSDSGLYFEKTTVGNFGSLLSLNSTFETTWGDLPKSINRDQMVMVLSSLDCLACIVLLIFGYWLSVRQETEAKAYSKREITVKKYTVEITNLPPYFHDRFRLAMWFQERFGQVVDCAIAFDQHDLLNMYRSRGIIRKDIDMAVSHGESHRLDGLYEHLAKIDNRIHDIQQDLSHRRTLGAYVTFEFQESRIACEKAFSHYWIKHLAGKLKNHEPVAPKDPSKSLLFGKGQRVLEVKQASEPSNILFKNLKYSPRNKLIRRITTFCATCILILISVIAVYLAQRYQQDAPSSNQTCASDISVAAAKSSSSLRDCFCYNLGTTAALSSERNYGVDCGPWLTSYAIARALSVLSVFTIVIVNFILKSVIKGLTKFEKHHSLTRQQESITNKLFVGLFLNTAIVLLVVNMQFKHYVTNIGFTIAFDGQYQDFVYDWFVHVGSSIILTMILNTINPHALPCLQVPWKRCRRETCCVPSRNQPQSVWNARYAGEEFELAERYAVLLNTIFVTLLYSGGMPLLLPIAALTFLFTYIMDKISFLRLYRIPPRFDHSLALYTTTLLPYAIFLHLAFTLWFLSAPLVHDTSLSSLNAETDTISNYQYQTFADRITGWSTLPILLLFLLVGSYLFLYRILFGLYQACSNDDGASDLNIDASKFVPYSVARRTVTLETYHPHGSPYYHDAFIRTPSRKMMKIPTPLHILQEQYKQQQLKEQQAAAAQPQQPPSLSIDIPSSPVGAISAPVPLKVSKSTTSPPKPAPKKVASPDLDEDEDEQRPGLNKAESMGIDSRNDMRVSQEATSKARDAAKEVAIKNGALSKQRSLGHARGQDLQPKFGVIEEELPPTGIVQPDAAGTNSFKHAAARKKKKSMSTLPATNGQVTRVEESPTSRTGASAAEGLAPIVILNIPDETATHLQQNVDEALQSPDDEKEGEPEVLARPFTSHLQHHARISLPSEDPLLDEVKAELHRMTSSMGEGDLPPGEVNRENQSSNKKKKTKVKKSKPASVHDSSSVPTLGDSNSVSITVQDDGTSSSVTTRETSQTSEDSSNPAGQLVPMNCPNVECGRVLELVDTGVSQLYHCPFCGSAFIM